MNCITKNPIDTNLSKASSAEEIEQRIGCLIRHYLRSRSPATALSVVSHIEALCDHPDLVGDAVERCVYLRMRAHWRWLARITPTGVEA
ncbi:MAG: ATP dependent RNA helicase [Chromatiales bacterium]|jgi:hypothetical protein